MKRAGVAFRCANQSEWRAREGEKAKVCSSDLAVTVLERVRLRDWLIANPYEIRYW